MKNTETTPFIFYLTLEENLSKSFYTFDRFFKELGYMLVPVRMDQLQTLVASAEQDQIIVISSVTDAKEYKLYNEKIRNFLKYVLKSKRLTFMHLSSFSKLNDQRVYARQKNYYFLRYPLDAKSLCSKIARYYILKKEQHTLWPGGKRSSLSGGVL